MQFRLLSVRCRRLWDSLLWYWRCNSCYHNRHRCLHCILYCGCGHAFCWLKCHCLLYYYALNTPPHIINRRERFITVPQSEPFCILNLRHLYFLQNHDINTFACLLNSGAKTIITIVQENITFIYAGGCIFYVCVPVKLAAAMGGRILIKILRLSK